MQLHREKCCVKPFVALLKHQKDCLNTLLPSLQYELEQSTSFSLHAQKLARNILSDKVRAMS